MSVIELVNTLTPFLYNLLIVLDTEAVLPGIGDEEKITTSSGISVICLWLPEAILDNAAKGSPWLPVHKRHTSLGFIWLASSAVIIILLSLK